MDAVGVMGVEMKVVVGGFDRGSKAAGTIWGYRDDFHDGMNGGGNCRRWPFGRIRRISRILCEA